MGKRKVVVRKSAAENIAAVAWYIESKGLLATAEKFVDSVYDFIEKLADPIRSYPVCREPKRNSLGFKCATFKKYTVVFYETGKKVIIVEFIPSKNLHW